MMRILSVAEELALRDAEWGRVKQGSLCSYFPANQPPKEVFFIVETKRYVDADVVLIDMSNTLLMLTRKRAIRTILKLSDMTCLHCRD